MENKSRPIQEQKYLFSQFPKVTERQLRIPVIINSEIPKPINNNLNIQGNPNHLPFIINEINLNNDMVYQPLKQNTNPIILPIFHNGQPTYMQEPKLVYVVEKTKEERGIELNRFEQRNNNILPQYPVPEGEIEERWRNTSSCLPSILNDKEIEIYKVRSLNKNKVQNEIDFPQKFYFPEGSNYNVTKINFIHENHNSIPPFEMHNQNKQGYKRTIPKLNHNKMPKSIILNQRGTTVNSHGFKIKNKKRVRFADLQMTKKIDELNKSFHNVNITPVPKGIVNPAFNQDKNKQLEFTHQIQTNNESLIKISDINTIKGNNKIEIKRESNIMLEKTEQMKKRIINATAKFKNLEKKISQIKGINWGNKNSAKKLTRNHSI